MKPEIIAQLEALAAALPPEVCATEVRQPTLQTLYIPRSHTRALGINVPLVVGARGVGKSFWTAALSDPGLHPALQDDLPGISKLRVFVGHGTETKIGDYPSQEVFEQLLQMNYEPFSIWQAIVLRQLANITDVAVPTDNWPNSVAWVRREPEKVAQFFEKANTILQQKEETALIIFDALDRVNLSWDIIDRMTLGLLQLVLRMMPYSSIKGKVFLREDHVARIPFSFPDASKLLATRVDLTWQIHDLHGLLWKLFCNAPDGHGGLLRTIFSRVIPDSLNEKAGAWQIRRIIPISEENLRKLFHLLTGPWMGKDKRRGIPYIWTVSHLADSRQQTSPRSFLKEIGSAVLDSAERYPEYKYAIHYESIKRGVQEASSIRVTEMTEDNPWVKDLFEPLRGINVPCPIGDIVKCWQDRFPDGLSILAQNKGLPPELVEKSWMEIRSKLEYLGLCSTMKDGRFNVPDLYRVGFGLGRMGGVRPMPK